MSTILNPTIQTTFPALQQSLQQRPSVLTQFIAWCDAQQHNRLLWLGIALAGHGCAITPITIAVVLLSGLHFGLFMTALGAMALALVVNLAALPTRITIPALAFTVVVDVVVIVLALTHALS